MTDATGAPDAEADLAAATTDGLQYAVGTDEHGRFTIVDQSHYPHIYPIAGQRYGTREEAQEKVNRYNAIMAGN